MKALRSILVISLVMASAWSLLAAGSVDPPAAVQASLDRDGAPQAVQPPVVLTPMMAEIQVALEANRAAVADLTVRFKAAVDEAEALELAREVGRVKLEGRLEILRIQLRFARDEGRDEAVAQLEAAIDKMTAQPRTGTPIARPAPQRPAGQ